MAHLEDTASRTKANKCLEERREKFYRDRFRPDFGGILIPRSNVWPLSFREPLMGFEQVGEWYVSQEAWISKVHLRSVRFSCSRKL